MIPDDLIGADLSTPRRVVLSEAGKVPFPSLIGRMATARKMQGKAKHRTSHARVLRDGSKTWETYHRCFWRLA